MIKAIKDFIFKDVKNENETKKIAVDIRINSLLMCLYFICLTIFFAVSGYGSFIFLCLVFFTAFLFNFFLTYMDATKTAAILTKLLILVYMIVFIMRLGFDFEIQYFILLVLIFNFAASNATMTPKLIKAAGLLVIQIGLNIYIQTLAPIYIMPASASLGLRIINIVFLFLAMTAILAFVNKDTMEMQNKLIQFNKKIKRLASLDPLTGLLNRRSMEEYLAGQVKQFEAGTGVDICIGIGDIDFFKNINDTYGHECGDIVLKNLSNLFNDFMEAKGKVSRWGGEEFLFAFYNCNGDEAYLHLSTLTSLINKSEFIYNDQVIKVTFTFGLEEVNYRRGIDDGIRKADEKLYLGKEAGRNRIFY